MALAKPCADCGTLTHNGTRCEACTRNKDHRRAKERTPTAKTSAHSRGYTSRWQRLSKQARQLQPFCSDCGATTDLQADHTPEAWQRHNQGLEVRLKDIDVVCGDCNRRRGAARGEHVTRPSKPTNTIPATDTQANRDRPSQSHTDTLGGVPSRSQPRPRPCAPSLDVLISGRINNAGGVSGGC